MLIIFAQSFNLNLDPIANGVCINLPFHTGNLTYISARKYPQLTQYLSRIKTFQLTLLSLDNDKIIFLSNRVCFDHNTFSSKVILVFWFKRCLKNYILSRRYLYISILSVLYQCSVV